MKHRIVLKKSIFPASQDIVWEKLQHLATLQYIAKPFASFSPLGEAGSFIWEEDRTFQFNFKLFCLIPFGIHTIHVVKFQKATYEVYTNEENTNVPVWNHKIVLKKIDDNTTEYTLSKLHSTLGEAQTSGWLRFISTYTDEVEIYAGWKTPFVYFWANLFYAHRQKKWLKLI